MEFDILHYHPHVGHIRKQLLCGIHKMNSDKHHGTDHNHGRNNSANEESLLVHHHRYRLFIT